MSELSNSIADDILRNGFERWQRLEGEKQAISDELKELFAELKGQGFDSKALRASFRMVAKAGDVAVEEHNALVDLYVGSLMGPRPEETGTDRATRSRAAREGESDDRAGALASLRADPAMAIVDVANLSREGRDPETGEVLPSANDVRGILNSEQQAYPQPACDLTVSPIPQGQVAPHREAKASTDSGATGPTIEQPGDSVTGDASRVSVGAVSDAPVSETDKSVEAPASAAPASKYAAPGVVVWETAPPEGVDQGAISKAFGTMGQDIALITDDLERRAAQPIIKKGNLILDGWARYNKARSMFEEVLEDGVTKRIPVPYQVVQYDGSDILVDIIKLNVDGRILTEDQKRKIAANLAHQEPSRKDDIYKAFEIFLEPV